MTKNAVISLLHLSHEMMAENKDKASFDNIYTGVRSLDLYLGSKSCFPFYFVCIRTSYISGLWGMRLLLRRLVPLSLVWPGSSHSGSTEIKRYV